MYAWRGANEELAVCLSGHHLEWIRSGEGVRLCGAEECGSGVKSPPISSKSEKVPGVPVCLLLKVDMSIRYICSTDPFTLCSYPTRPTGGGLLYSLSVLSVLWGLISRPESGQARFVFGG